MRGAGCRGSLFAARQPLSEIARKQRLIARHRLDVLYEAAGTRAGTNFLLDATETKCLRAPPNATHEPAAARPRRLPAGA